MVIEKPLMFNPSIFVIVCIILINVILCPQEKKNKDEYYSCGFQFYNVNGQGTTNNDYIIRSSNINAKFNTDKVRHCMITLLYHSLTMCYSLLLFHSYTVTY